MALSPPKNLEEHMPDQKSVERVTDAATEVLGCREAARLYMQTKNFALGGSTPLNLLDLADGESVVLQELQTHRDSGPL